LIIRHNYSRKYVASEKTSGIYNVAMIIIKNNKDGLACLRWWRQQCLEWCYDRFENGKFGDQLYLDDWTERFEGVHVLKNKGANLAPWNINRYIIKKEKDKIFVDEDELIFYHFHSLKIFDDGTFKNYTYYIIDPSDEILLYLPYQKQLKSVISRLKSIEPDFHYGFGKKDAFFVKWKERIRKNLFLFILKKTKII